MDSSFYRHLLSKIKKSNAVAHHNFPCHNLLSVENLLEVSANSNTPEDDSQFLGSMPCYQKFPYAVSRSSPCFSGSGVTDDALGLVRKKLKWQKDSNNYKLDNVEEAVQQIHDLLQDKDVKLSKNLRKYVNHICNDPEPMFYGNYNWLYSSGTLNYVEAFDGTIIITADTFDKKPGFNVLQFDENSEEIHNKCSFTLKTSPVLQITTKSRDDDVIICVRQKNHLNLFSFTNTGCTSQLVRLWRKKVNPPKLIICADIKSSCEEVLLSDSKQDLHVFHMERKNKIFGCAGKNIFPDVTRDPWSQVEFGHLGIYVAFRNCFVILDPRDPNSASLEYSPSHVVNNCEDICSFGKSPSDPNFMYLATTHSILQLDVRNGQAVQKWTHLMKKPPQFMAATKDGQENEILVLQSQDVGEVLGIVNEPLKDGEKVNFLSRSLPCLLSSVKESLMMARYRGVCLSPFLAERIDFGITGMQCVKNNAGDINVFVNNSVGDIFLSQMRKTETLRLSREEDERRTVEAMKIYEAQVQNLSPQQSISPHLELTDMSHVLKGLRDSKPRPRARSRTAEFDWKYHEMYAPESLALCRDVLAQKILNVWGYGADDDHDDDDDDDLANLTMSAEEKVREWMCRN